MDVDTTRARTDASGCARRGVGRDPTFTPHTETRGNHDVVPPILRTQRALQLALAFLSILDAALQFQPYMFGQGFINSFILNNAHGLQVDGS